jgi:hypothetical protein
MGGSAGEVKKAKADPFGMTTKLQQQKQEEGIVRLRRRMTTKEGEG